MLTEIYVEAVDEDLADLVWEFWDAGKTGDCVACLMWRWTVTTQLTKDWLI
jgi:hypothetical protein